MRLKKLLVSAVLSLACVGGFTAVEAGASFTDCKGSPTGDGWFDSYNPGGAHRHAAVKCTVDGNHVVANITSIYNGVSYTAYGVIDSWIPTNTFCNEPVFYNGSPAGLAFRFDTTAKGGYGCGYGITPATQLIGPSLWWQNWVSQLGNYAQTWRRGTTSNTWTGSDEGITYMDSNGWNNTLSFAQFRTESIASTSWANFTSEQSVWAF